MEAGLPNITGSITYLVRSTNDANYGVDGAFTDIGPGWWMGGSNQAARTNIGFDASLCSSIYGASNVVTPLSQSALLLMKY